MARSVTLRNPRTGEVRTVRAGGVPFFTNQGFELVDEPAPDEEPPGRHEAPDEEPPADPAGPGASTTTPDPTSKEN